VTYATWILQTFASLTASTIFLCSVALAQTQNDPGNEAAEENSAKSATGKFEAGLLVGTMLPSGISGVTEIMGLADCTLHETVTKRLVGGQSSHG